MAKYKNKYRINSNRHPYWNYSRPGAYFITLCTLDRVCYLGDISDGKMHLSEFGQLVRDEILCIDNYHPQVKLGGWVVMPDHVHLMVNILDGAKCDGVNDGNVALGVNDGNVTLGVNEIHEFHLRPTSSTHQTPTTPLPPFPTPSSSKTPWWYDPNYPSMPNDIKQYRNHRRTMIIPKIMGKFKMMSSREINALRKAPKQKNWQNDYYDHIVRNDVSYLRIQRYIKTNPKKWNKNKRQGELNQIISLSK